MASLAGYFSDATGTQLAIAVGNGMATFIQLDPPQRGRVAVLDVDDPAGLDDAAELQAVPARDIAAHSVAAPITVRLVRRVRLPVPDGLTPGSFMTGPR